MKAYYNANYMKAREFILRREYKNFNEFLNIIRYGKNHTIKNYWNEPIKKINQKQTPNLILNWCFVSLSQRCKLICLFKV